MKQVSFSRITIVQMEANLFSQGVMLLDAFRIVILDVYTLSYMHLIVPCLKSN